jgi:isocitrate/isopropylmalate dehydrogenase
VKFSAKNVIPATLIDGDGIGPEIVEASIMMKERRELPGGYAFQMDTRN